MQIFVRVYLNVWPGFNCFNYKKLAAPSIIEISDFTIYFNDKGFDFIFYLLFYCLNWRHLLENGKMPNKLNKK